MSETQKFTATLGDDRQSFILRGPVWHNEYPISDLEKWLSFYRRMKVEHPKSTSNYDAPISALEKLKYEIG